VKLIGMECFDVMATIGLRQK